MSYAIQNTEGDHLGFLLFAGEGNKGDCIFRSLPNKPELFETEQSEILFNMQEQGEFQYQISKSEIEITNINTGSKATINNGELEINGYKFKIIEMGAS